MIRRKKTAFILLLAQICFLGTALAASFSDVPENTVHYKAVEYLKQKGIISGYSDGTFRPDKNINRAEALKIIMLAIGGKLSQTQEQTQNLLTTEQLATRQTVPAEFPDVQSSDWFSPFVKSAAGLRIVAGYPDGTFKPANNINVAESLKMIEVAFGADLTRAITENPFGDVDKAVWYAPYAAYGKSKQVVWSQDDGKLHAEREITRGEFAQIIYRLVYIQDNKLDKFPLDTDWPTFSHPSDHYTIKYPYDWQQIAAGKQTIFWKQDTGNRQVSFARVYPDSATLVVAVDQNTDRLSLDDYLARLQYDPSAAVKKLTLNQYPFASITLANEGITDYYFEFPNSQILIVYSQVGSGLNRPQLSDQIRYMIGSIRYREGTSAPAVSAKEQFLGGVRLNILVQGKGQETLNMFTDLVLIQTDTIGIGTGPVDYYYSAKYDVTLKLERDSNLILALQDGKSTAF